MDSNDQNTKVSPVVVVTDCLNDKVIDIIAKMTGRDSVFTSFDVTKLIRIENPTMNVPHNDVRDMVFEAYQNTFCDDYERTLTELSVGYSYVYHPDTVSASTHPLAVQPVADDTNTDPAVINDTDLTTEKRLNISKTHLDAMGLKSGDMVRLDTENGVLSITACTSSPYETLFVNSDGRLRLNARTLTRAFSKLHDKFEILLSSDKTAITVRPIEVIAD